MPHLKLDLQIQRNGPGEVAPSRGQTKREEPSLGNHDDPNQRLYKPFNMDGHRYYTFSRGPVTFFVLDTTYMDRAQLDWLERESVNAPIPSKH